MACVDIMASLLGFHLFSLILQPSSVKPCRGDSLHKLCASEFKPNVQQRSRFCLESCPISSPSLSTCQNAQRSSDTLESMGPKLCPSFCLSVYILRLNINSNLEPLIQPEWVLWTQSRCHKINMLGQEVLKGEGAASEQ